MSEPGSDLDAILSGSEAGAAGPREDFDDFARAVWPSLVRTARLMGASAASAEDHAQAALVKAHLAWRRVRRTDDPVAYVHRIVVNSRIDETRLRSFRDVPSERVGDAGRSEDMAAGIATRADLAVALSALPIKQRQVVVLRFFVGMSEAEIAGALRVPAGTVKSRAARALEALADDPRIADSVRRST